MVRAQPYSLGRDFPLSIWLSSIFHYCSLGSLPKINVPQARPYPRLCTWRRPPFPEVREGRRAREENGRGAGPACEAQAGLPGGAGEGAAGQLESGSGSTARGGDGATGLQGSQGPGGGRRRPRSRTHPEDASPSPTVRRPVTLSLALAGQLEKTTACPVLGLGPPADAASSRSGALTFERKPVVERQRGDRVGWDSLPSTKSPRRFQGRRTGREMRGLWGRRRGAAAAVFPGAPVTVRPPAPSPSLLTQTLQRQDLAFVFTSFNLPE